MVRGAGRRDYREVGQGVPVARRVTAAPTQSSIVQRPMSWPARAAEPTVRTAAGAATAREMATAEGEVAVEAEVAEATQERIPQLAVATPPRTVATVAPVAAGATAGTDQGLESVGQVVAAGVVAAEAMLTPSPGPAGRPRHLPEMAATVAMAAIGDRRREPVAAQVVEVVRAEPGRRHPAVPATERTGVRVSQANAKSALRHGWSTRASDYRSDLT